MARASKLTETAIKAIRLDPNRKQEIHWDSVVTGLGLRVLPGGSKTFWYQYGSHMIRIGSWPEVSLADARAAAKGHAGAVARGEDPAAEKQEAKRRSAATLRQLLAENGEYERSLKRRHLVNINLIMSSLRRGLVRLMGKDVKDITRQDFVTAITAIEDQGKPGAAAGLRTFSMTFCEWAVGRGLAPANVMAGLRRPKQTRAERLAAEERKARALSDAEIIAVWNATENRGPLGKVIRMLLLTGTRRNEIAKLTREQILADRLVLPPSHTKTGEKHEVPLTDLMRAVIAAQPVALGSKLAFPSDKTGGVMSGWSKTIPALRKASGVVFTPHDLRRTCRTLMSRLGVDHEIAELAVGHKRHGLDRLYNFDQAWQLRCEAFAKVSGHVAELLSLAAKEGKVIAIPTRG